MIESLRLIYSRLLEETTSKHFRFLFNKLDLNNRLIGIVGPRGVGKTTLMLQLIKHKMGNSSKAFYFSADHIYFNKSSIYEFIEKLVLTDCVETVFIDEIHKYRNWNQELKNLYDAFPKLNLIFSGSSSLDLIKGSYDLSRRAVMYQLPGLSLREYINFTTDSDIQTVSFDELINNPEQLNNTLSSIPKLLGHFKDYCKQGFYPFYYENPLSYYNKILEVINKTIFEDVVNYYNFKTTNLHQLNKILVYLSSIKPGTVSTHNIAKNLSIDDKTVINYLISLAETGLISLIYPAEPGNAQLRRPDKIFLQNTNLQYALEGKIGADVELGAIRELFFIQSTKNADLDVFHSKQGDYQINNNVFEIGGKNKTRKQVKNIDNAFLVLDDVLTASSHRIPLVYFGFLY